MANSPGSRSVTPAGAALWAVLMLAWLPAAAQNAPPPPGPMDRPYLPGPPDRPFLPGMGPGPGDGHAGGPLSELARAEANQVASRTIAELTHAPLADVQRVVRTWGPPAALRYFDVSPRMFHEATTPRLVALVRAASRDALISGEEADRMVDRLQHEGPPPDAPPN